MNNKILGFVLFLLCASLFTAQAQEPPGCKAITSKKNLTSASEQQSQISGKLPKRKVLDLRKKKRHVVQADSDPRSIPVIASPIYLPQTGTAGTAITASNGFLYVVVGQKLYKVNEKSLKTVQVSQLGHTVIEPAMETEPPKRKKKIMASTADEPTEVHKTTKKHHSSKTD